MARHGLVNRPNKATMPPAALSRWCTDGSPAPPACVTYIRETRRKRTRVEVLIFQGERQTRRTRLATLALEFFVSQCHPFFVAVSPSLKKKKKKTSVTSVTSYRGRTAKPAWAALNYSCGDLMCALLVFLVASTIGQCRKTGLALE